MTVLSDPRGLAGEYHAIASLQAAQNLDPRAVADAYFHVHLAASARRTDVYHVHRRVALVVEGDRRLWQEQRVRKLLEDDLRVGRHVGLQLLGDVVDRDFHLERGDVVLFDADRRDLGDPPLEGLVGERFGGDPGRL